MGILISRRMLFNLKLTERTKGGYFIHINRTIQEATAILNIFAPNTAVCNLVKQSLIDLNHR